MANGTVVDLPYGGGCPPAVANLDVIRIVTKLDRVAVEMALCQSADLNGGLLEFDNERVVGHLADFAAFMAYAISQPIPDTPEAHGRARDSVPAVSELFPGIGTCENGDVAAILRQCRTYRMEIANCQSSRLVQGILPFDAERFTTGLERINKLVEYASTHEPTDMPESTPQMPPVPAGH